MTALTRVADAAAEPSALLVAFASMDGDMVDQHFGSAQAFYLYAVDADSAETDCRAAFCAGKDGWQRR